MKPLIFSALIAAFGTDAAALSCLRPDLAGAFSIAERRAEHITILRGTFEFDERLLPLAALNQTPIANAIPARFSGFGLSTTGFDRPIDQTIMVTPSCLGHWCGTLRPGTKVIAFAVVEDTGLRVSVGPCPGDIFYDDTPAAEDVLAACLRGEACEMQQ